MSLARQHFHKHSAKAAAESAAEFGTMQEQTFYELQLTQLNNDIHRLKQIQSIEAKIQLKQALVPTYLPYVDGIIEANKPIQDNVFMTVLVWCIDTGFYEKAVEMAEFALRHSMIMPDRFERQTATLVVEEISNAFLKKLKTSAEIDLPILWALETILESDDIPKESLDMPDQVRAKLLVALAKGEIKEINSAIEANSGEIDDQLPEWIVPHALKAKARLERAIELDDRCNGKQDLKSLTTLLKKFPEQKEPENTSDSDNKSTEQGEPLLNTNGSQVVDDQGNLAFKTT
ncbi:phage terminase small subunit [Acinetobacter calcoaceticus]|uniref:phage terminase small subunit n=1 Tax=Acinetobacter calcoaceticus TaxID=471 RepID=UPI0018DDB9BE|nr:phage terminase small subunit [Acinetobacter calcoaceticus]